MIEKGMKFRHIHTKATNIVLDIGESRLFKGTCVFYRRDEPLIGEEGEVFDIHVKPIEHFKVMYRRYD